MKPKSRKLLLSILVVVVSLGVGAWALLRGQGAVQYRTARVERGDIDSTISATGSPNAVVTVQVGSQVSGSIQALYADFNTKVRKGQLVARIDPQLFQARVDQAQATVDATKAAVVNARAVIVKAQAGVASANAAVANARANVLKAQVAVADDKVKYDRRVPLAKEGVISAEDLDTAKAAYDSAVAGVEAAQAEQLAARDNVDAAKADLEATRTQVASSEAQVKQTTAALDQTRLDLEHTYIRAPVDGVVVARNVDVGQTVAASLQTPTLFQIAQDLTKMQVDTNVSEADVGRVKVGQAATFTVDAYPGQVFKGQVSQIREAPINVQNVITYDVVIAVANPDLKLFPGMTANEKILVDTHGNVLKVANAALRFQPPDAAPNPGGGKSGSAGSRKAAVTQTIWALQANGKLRPVPVTVGLTDGNFTEITGDLKEGDQVVVAAFSTNGNSGAAPPAAGGKRGPQF